MLFALARVWWRIRKPRTFGVKVVVQPDGDDGRLLLVRHSYGDKRLWNLPGGGYSPRREAAFDAAARELREELEVEVDGLRPLGTYQTGAEGKVDTVQIFHARLPAGAELSPSQAELSDFAWFELESVFGRDDVARVARTGVRQLRGENDFETYVQSGR